MRTAKNQQKKKGKARQGERQKAVQGGKGTSPRKGKGQEVREGAKKETDRRDARSRDTWKRQPETKGLKAKEHGESGGGGKSGFGKKRGRDLGDREKRRTEGREERTLIPKTGKEK